MARSELKLTRHLSVLSERETDAVVGIVAGLIADYLKNGQVGRSASQHGPDVAGTRAAGTREQQK